MTQDDTRQIVTQIRDALAPTLGELSAAVGDLKVAQHAQAVTLNAVQADLARVVRTVFDGNGEPSIRMAVHDLKNTTDEMKARCQKTHGEQVDDAKASRVKIGDMGRHIIQALVIAVILMLAVTWRDNMQAKAVDAALAKIQADVADKAVEGNAK